MYELSLPHSRPPALQSTHTYITCSQIPKATSVRFQPHTADFLDMAASMGPKVHRR